MFQAGLFGLLSCAPFRKACAIIVGSHKAREALPDRTLPCNVLPLLFQHFQQGFLYGGQGPGGGEGGGPHVDAEVPAGARRGLGLALAAAVLDQDILGLGFQGVGILGFFGFWGLWFLGLEAQGLILRV